MGLIARHLYHSIRHGPGRLKQWVPCNQSLCPYELKFKRNDSFVVPRGQLNTCTCQIEKERRGRSFAFFFAQAEGMGSENAIL